MLLKTLHYKRNTSWNNTVNIFKLNNLKKGLEYGSFLLFLLTEKQLILIKLQLFYYDFFQQGSIFVVSSFINLFHKMVSTTGFLGFEDKNLECNHIFSSEASLLSTHLYYAIFKILLSGLGDCFKFVHVVTDHAGDHQNLPKIPKSLPNSTPKPLKVPIFIRKNHLFTSTIYMPSQIMII